MIAGDWRELRIGDRIRIVSLPTGLDESLWPAETLAVYRMLIARRRPVRVYEIDAWNMPWIRFLVRGDGGRWVHHGLLINHDGWVRVRSRT